ncbi:hypothetical protein TNCV_2687701 [Trichonephila clavipes]|nr:hypothetical protein TNCV_2687701 [Trichonephila clavipes]
MLLVKGIEYSHPKVYVTGSHSSYTYRWAVIVTRQRTEIPDFGLVATTAPTRSWRVTLDKVKRNMPDNMIRSQSVTLVWHHFKQSCLSYRVHSRQIMIP